MATGGGGIQNLVSKPAKSIRVILADDHTLVRAGIRALLEKLPEVKVIGEAGDGREVLDLVRSHQPDVVLLDIAMPGLNGLEAAERMAGDFPKIRIIILSMHNNEEYVLRALKAGAAGYLLKKAATTELATALHEVVRGEIYLSEEIKLQKNFPLHGITNQKSPLEQLTGRQREILQLIAEGKANKETAAELGISIKTVEKHRGRLMSKLNIHDTAGLTRYAIGAGIIESSVQLTIV